MDAQIRAARERGDFDDLPGRGESLELDDVPPTFTSEQRFEALLLRTLGELPLEVALVRDIRACRVALDQDPPPDEYERLQASRSQKFGELCALLRGAQK